MMIGPITPSPFPFAHASLRDGAVDAWIGRELRRAYRETMEEPVPAALLDLLDGSRPTAQADKG